MRITAALTYLAMGLAIAGCGGGPADEAGLSPAQSPVQNGSPRATQTAAVSGSPDFATWDAYAGGADASQYSSLDQINQSNVTDLGIAWSFPVGGRSFVFNPIVVGNTIYVLARDNEIVALDAATGAELWSYASESGVSARGIHYWHSADGADRRIVFQGGGYVQEINAGTGRPITSFGDNGRVDMRQAIDGGRDISSVRPLSTSNPGRVFENLMIVSLPAQGAGYESPTSAEPAIMIKE